VVFHLGFLKLIQVFALSHVGSEEVVRLIQNRNRHLVRIACLY
jgi:hypothetical protein